MIDVAQTDRTTAAADRNPQLDRIARLAAHVFDAPLAFINRVDASGVQPLARAGVAADVLTNSQGFCEHAVLQAGPLVIDDALRDTRVASLTVVAGHPHVRFYAGCALMGADVRTIGSLCVLDMRPRVPSAAALGALRDLAALAQHVLLTVAPREQAAPRAAQRDGEDELRHGMVRSMTHDFRSTLAGIIGFSELMADPSFTPEQLREFASDMNVAALRLNQMIDNLLELSLLPDPG